MAGRHRRSLGYWSLKLGDIQRFSFVVGNFNVPSFAGPNAGFCDRYQLAVAFPLHRLVLFCRDYSINQLATPQRS